MTVKKVNLGKELTDEELMDMIGGFTATNLNGPTVQPLYGIKPSPTPHIQPLYGIKPTPSPTPNIQPLYGIKPTATPYPNPQPLYGIRLTPTPKL